MKRDEGGTMGEGAVEAEFLSRGRSRDPSCGKECAPRDQEGEHPRHGKGRCEVF